MLTVFSALAQKLVMTAPAAHIHISVYNLTKVEGQPVAAMSQT